MGLTIVRAIVDAHDGTIAVASSTGADSGAVVSVMLPRPQEGDACLRASPVCPA